METIEAEIQGMVDRETAAWDRQDASALVDLFHPDMVWPWPPDNRSHDPALWEFTQGRFNRERWSADWESLFRSYELVHNRRKTVRIQLSAEGDGAFAVVDVDTLWKSKSDGSAMHWKGRAGKGYSKIGDQWLLSFHTGLLDYAVTPPGATEGAKISVGHGADSSSIDNLASRIMGRIVDALLAVTKRIASYAKDNWDLDDYPIRVVGRDIDLGKTLERPKVAPWSAKIINWWQMAGHGDTREEAMANLRQNLASYLRSRKALPRPGTGAPLEFASTHLVEKHRELARDFMSRILSLDLDECFISDDSSLWDFNSEETNDHYYRKIILIYGVDVSDVDGAKLWLIFERIGSHRGSG